MESTTKAPVTVETLVNAPIEKVWKAFTEPGHITKWCQASDDWHAPYADNDLRKGGKFTTTMAAKDGSVSFDFSGIYDDVREHELIEYTMSDGRKVKVIFTSDGDKTRVTETFDTESTHSEEMQRSGWQAILDNFRKHVESDN